MQRPVSDIAFSPSVKAVQERLGSRHAYAKMENGRGWSDRVTPDLAQFVADVNSFFLATANAQGQPYIQHRGGPKGFLKVLDERTLAFADFGGNKQYISLGNLSENDQALLFLIDYTNQQRIKLWGRMRVVESDPKLLAELADPSYTGKPERAFVFDLTAWDANCPQHIPRLYTDEEVSALRNEIAELQRRVRQLESTAL